MQRRELLQNSEAGQSGDDPPHTPARETTTHDHMEASWPAAAAPSKSGSTLACISLAAGALSCMARSKARQPDTTGLDPTAPYCCESQLLRLTHLGNDDECKPNRQRGRCWTSRHSKQPTGIVLIGGIHHVLAISQMTRNSQHVIITNAPSLSQICVCSQLVSVSLGQPHFISVHKESVNFKSSRKSIQSSFFWRQHPRCSAKDGAELVSDLLWKFFSS